MKLTYTEEQIGQAFDEPVNGVKRFFKEADKSVSGLRHALRGAGDEESEDEPKEKKEPKKEKETPIGEFDDDVETEDEPKEKEPKEPKEEKDETMSTKVRKVINDLESKKDGYDFISMTDLDVGHQFKSGDYQSLIAQIADKKILVSRLSKSGKTDPEGPDSVPADEIIFWMKGR